ncbi:MAG: disulfide bond formation protein DsbA [Candidatus Liberibacter europaeus]|uniref:Disulfide bond formation protein DsbA n=1 Tax=Candidatus Liberibacter europaeus TaxID=744859 RepID=A0A2T4VYZ0_9HYPH|nr:MAG: disulfide bond formation protein DsbA [Candidatus Liberibacter europaeus]
MVSTRMGFLVAIAISSIIYGCGKKMQESSDSVLLPSPVKVVSDVNLSASSMGNMIDISIGRQDAPVTIIEYSSMTCFHCASFHNNVFGKIEDKYIKTGKVRYILREFPMDSASMAASMLARCAENRSEGGYFGFLSIVFKNNEDLLKSSNYWQFLLNMAKVAGFSQREFDSCLKNQDILDNINLGKKRALEKFSIDATPSFLIGGNVYAGAMSADIFFKIIDSML